MKIIVVKPNETPIIQEVENKLKTFQDIVGGTIQCVPLTKDIVLTCNDEGKLLDMPINRTFGNDILCGTFFITQSNNEGDFISLSDDNLKYIKSRILTDLPLDNK